jgi:hypothetical protein
LETPYQLEVKIIKEAERFIASCGAFPSCKGIGETEKEALEKLGNSISRAIGKMTRESIKSVLLSDHYTDIIFEEKEDKKEQRRVFNLNSSSQTQKRVLIKLMAFQKMNQQDQLEYEDISDFFQSKETPSFMEPKAMDDVISTIEKSKNPPTNDGYLFGFPISFN